MMKNTKKIATISQADEMYLGIIRDEYGFMEAATVKETASDVHTWADEHDCDDIILT